ncbi:MAG: dihydropteroate synthase [Proteobacteria bacterium]|nr:MAG: dihydropteroate synthase [Pseudomonadota bacterium]
MTCHKISSDVNLEKIISQIGSTKAGEQIMFQKGKVDFFHIKKLKTPAANILKQEALSLGADVAVPKGVIVCESDFVECLLIISRAKLSHLIEKLLSQPFGLKDLAKDLKKHLDAKTFKPKIMGVLNANEDSFFHGSRFDERSAQQKIEDMIAHGAHIIDIGAVSSRPGSEGVSDEVELDRLGGIIDIIYKNKLYEKVIFSLDTYSPLCARYVLDRGFKIINDITALQNDELAKICGEYEARVCLMHMQNDPKTMQNDPEYEDVVEEIDKFFTKRIEKAKNFGIKDIILDVGIGFGKNLYHNLILIKNQAHFLHHGYELLVGTSRKSMIDRIISSSIDERLPGTLMLHFEAVRNGASIIRCHDVKEHFQALKVYEALKDVV